MGAFRITYLRQACGDPDRIKDGVGEYSLEDITLTMDFPGVKFVEKSHHNERVEDDGEVLRWTTASLCYSSASIYVEHLITYKPRDFSFETAQSSAITLVVPKIPNRAKLVDLSSPELACYFFKCRGNKRMEILRATRVLQFSTGRNDRRCNFIRDDQGVTQTCEG